MATANHSVTNAWSLAVAAASGSFLISSDYEMTIRVATTAADGTAPGTTIVGHVLTRMTGGAISRNELPTGAVWVKAPDLPTGASIVIAKDVG